MSVELLPAELGFKRPFNHEVTEILKLSNPNSAPVAFKVKTTAPKQYCVRPNSGSIQPNESVEVQVLLQAMKEDPPLDAKCRDKFLVQSVLMTNGDESDNLAGFWQSIEKTSKASIQERKIRVNFLPPGGGTSSATAINGVAQDHHEDQPPAYSSPSPQFGSPAPQSSQSISSATRANNATDTGTRVVEATGITAAATAVANVIPTSGESLQQQLAAANAQISKLTSQLADPEVRQRKLQEASDKVQTVVQQSNESGVPLQIVAGLCLLSFLIAYLFF